MATNLIWKWSNANIFDSTSPFYGDFRWNVYLKVAVINITKKVNGEEKCSNQKMEKLMGWQGPPVGQIKMNSDGSVHQYSNFAAYRGVLRDLARSLIFGYASKIGIC